jgi:glycosyltransferase involved in cell wall biosynthesis
MKLSIIIPAYNEEGTVEELLKKVSDVQIKGYEKEIIVIDDGSEDKTRDILDGLKNKLGFTFLKHPKNIGKGGAIKTGLKKVTGDFVIIQDADLEYEPKDYSLLLESIEFIFLISNSDSFRLAILKIKFVV